MKTINLIEWIDSGTSQMRFWGVVLLVAIKDNSSRVVFDPSLGEQSLSYSIDGISAPLAPPPAEMAREIERSIRDLLSDSAPRRFLSRIFPSFVGSTVQGKFEIVIGDAKAEVNGLTNGRKSTVELTVNGNDAVRNAANVALKRFRTKQSEAQSTTS